MPGIFARRSEQATCIWSEQGVCIDENGAERSVRPPRGLANKSRLIDQLLLGRRVVNILKFGNQTVSGAASVIQEVLVPYSRDVQAFLFTYLTDASVGARVRTASN